MAQTKGNRPLFFYPDYLKDIFVQLIRYSKSDDYPLLNKRIDLIHILYNQYNNFPITEQVYDMVWCWVGEMVEANHSDWIRQYWSNANQYHMFKLDQVGKQEERERFLEFHIMMGVLLLYKKKYELLKYLFEYTSVLPAKFPLIPSTFRTIFSIYETLSEKNERMYLLKYQMPGMTGGAREVSMTEGLLIDYLALLLIRLQDVNDYNITFSDPMALPPSANTVEQNERKIDIAEVFIKRVEKWRNKGDELHLCGVSANTEGITGLLEDFQEECKSQQRQLIQKAEISDEKVRWLCQNLLSAIENLQIELPLINAHAKKTDIEVVPYKACQTVRLDKQMILTGYDPIGSNIAEALINSLVIQTRKFYSYQFLLNSPVTGYTVPYKDLGEALRKLSIPHGFCILSMGVSRIVFGEIEGFTIQGKSISFSSTPVIEIASNEDSLIIMRKEIIPRISFRPLDETEKADDDRELDADRHVYTNIDSIHPDYLELSVKMGVNINIYQPFRYVRIHIAYHLKSDDILINKIRPISEFII